MASAAERVFPHEETFQSCGEDAAARAGMYAAPVSSPGVAVATVLCGLALAAGWRVRDELYLTPESGLGYALGITGLGFMVFQLLYTLRKRLRPLRSWGRLKPWFQIHMVIGVVAPAAILFHSNFRLGSVNSSVALACLLVVTGSGYAGRFIYTKIHLGLHGRRQELQEVRRAAETSRSVLGSLLAGTPGLATRLQEFEARALPSRISVPGAMWRFVRVGSDAQATQRACVRILRRSSGKSGQGQFVSRATRDLRNHTRAVVRVARFTAYERLFALWHAAHVPLCFLLFAAALVHVVAVHMF